MDSFIKFHTFDKSEAAEVPILVYWFLHSELKAIIDI